METFNNISKNAIIKIGIIALTILLLLIPLSMVKGVISERETTKKKVEEEVAASYAKSQTIGGPIMRSTLIVKPRTDSTAAHTKTWQFKPSLLDYKAHVTTDILRRSIYDVIVYNSTIEVTGRMAVTDESVKATDNVLILGIKDFKGLTSLPVIDFGGKTFTFEKVQDELLARVEIPQTAKAGDEIDFSATVNIRGTESLMFHPDGWQTTLSIDSPYPHPSFQGEFLPQARDIREDGFSAFWSVLSMNTNSEYDLMGVRFVDPANPYQQTTRSAKYGILIIILVFLAGLLMEYLTKKEINIIQYIVIGCSLVLFYALLLSFSEFIMFGLAYIIAAVMTTSALVVYFRAILKNSKAFIMGGLIASVYGINYLLLQMDTYALLTGSLVLFALLSVVMYFTANSPKPASENN